MDDESAEKAWEAWSPALTDLNREAPTYYEAFMAGRESRDVEQTLAELAERTAQPNGLDGVL